MEHNEVPFHFRKIDGPTSARCGNCANALEKEDGSIECGHLKGLTTDDGHTCCHYTKPMTAVGHGE